ncbi:P-loop containing nucleoside triphosphate hydrolase protein, partial [Hanseniaspora valbyensis NRRL Y-1626]
NHHNIVEDLPATSYKEKEKNTITDTGTTINKASSEVSHSLKEDTQNIITKKDVSTKIKLIQVSGSISDSFANVFGFKEFNKMQSESFHTLYESDYNVVVSAPTSSGKTVLFELAIIKCILKHNKFLKNLKMVYLAPTKALCSEKFDKWQRQFKQLKVGLLTSDTSNYEVDSFESLNLVLCTPEKLDLLTRKWNNYKKTFFLGGILEAVLTRLKKLNKKTRMIVVSATIPNINDLQEWLSNKTNNTKVLQFDSSYRPIKIDTKIESISLENKNDFQAEKLYINKVPELIKKYSKTKSTLVFCATRASTQQTAKCIIEKFNLKCEINDISFIEDSNLRDCCRQGVGYHHAGLSMNDRKIVEKLFKNGGIEVLCSTSTLAVGVNINCFLVIIKGTSYWSSEGSKEYSDLEMLQMIGRAGRPGEHDSGVAIILTSNAKAGIYEKLVSGVSTIESTIHLQFLEHICSEIEIGSIEDIDSCVEWIRSTFYYVRVKKNPQHYNLSESKLNLLENDLQKISKNLIKTLIDNKLIQLSDDKTRLFCTEYGKSMCRNYISFKTIKYLLSSEVNMTLKNLLSLIAKAYVASSSVKIKQQDKVFLRTLNNFPNIKYQLKDESNKQKKLQNFNESWQKVFLLIQLQLDDVDIFSQGNFKKIISTVNQDINNIFKTTPRILSCLLDILVFRKDGISIANILFLTRSFNGKAWDDSPMTMMQVETLGLASVKLLLKKKIKNLKQLRLLSVPQLEYYLGTKPGNGYKLKNNISKIPFVTLSAEIENFFTIKSGKVLVQLRISIECSKITAENKKYNNSFVDMLVRNSNGDLCDYRKISTFKLFTKKTFTIKVKLKSQVEYYEISVSLQKVAGSSETAKLEIECPEEYKHLLPESKLDQSFADFCLNNSRIDSNKNYKKFDVVSMLNKSIEKRNVNQKKSEVENSLINTHFCKNKGTCRHLCCQEGIPKEYVKKNKKSLSTNQQNELKTNNFVNTNVFSPPKKNIVKLRFKEPSGIESFKLSQSDTLKKLNNKECTDLSDSEIEKYVINSTIRPEKQPEPEINNEIIINDSIWDYEDDESDIIDKKNEFESSKKKPYEILLSSDSNDEEIKQKHHSNHYSLIENREATKDYSKIPSEASSFIQRLQKYNFNENSNYLEEDLTENCKKNKIKISLYEPNLKNKMDQKSNISDLFTSFSTDDLVTTNVSEKVTNNNKHQDNTFKDSAEIESHPELKLFNKYNLNSTESITKMNKDTEYLDLDLSYINSSQSFTSNISNESINKDTENIKTKNSSTSTSSSNSNSALKLFKNSKPKDISGLEFLGSDIEFE